MVMTSVSWKLSRCSNGLPKIVRGTSRVLKPTVNLYSHIAGASAGTPNEKVR
jgi:hypothetical protein